MIRPEGAVRGSAHRRRTRPAGTAKGRDHPRIATPGTGAEDDCGDRGGARCHHHGGRAAASQCRQDQSAGQLEVNWAGIFHLELVPSPFSSGSTDRDQGISKAGNPKARSTMIELAWMWLRYQPDSTLSIAFRQRVGDRKGRVRRIAIVALARKLLVALWRYLETGLVPAGAVFKTR